MNAMELVQKVLECGLEKDPRVAALLNCVIADPGDREKAALLDRLVGSFIVHQQMFGKPFKEADERADGMIRFAVTAQGLPVGFSLDEPHCLVVGQTGSGKSILLMLILAQAIAQGV